MRHLITLGTVTLSLFSTAQAAPSILDTLNIPGTSTAKPTATEDQMMGMGFFTAQNLLSGRTAPSGGFPCVENDAGTALLQQNTKAAYDSIKASFVKQGWALSKEVKVPVGEAYAFLFKKQNKQLMGLWVRAEGPNAKYSRLSICQPVPGWDAAPKATAKPAPKTAVVTESAEKAGSLTGPLVFQVPQWEDAGTLYGSGGWGANKEVVVVRGTITGQGKAQLTLPKTVPAGALLPAKNLEQAVTRTTSPCTTGFTVSDPKVKLLAVQELLRSDAKANATDAQVLEQGDIGRTIFNGQTKKNYTLLGVLMYATGPVKIQGKLNCSSSEIRNVNLNLPTGWSIVYWKKHFPNQAGPSDLVNAPAVVGQSFWQW